MKKLLLLFSMFAAIAVTSCSKDADVNLPSNEKKPITIGLSTKGVSYSDLPSSRATELGDLLAVQIYEVNGDVATPYANGLFDDWSALSFEGYSNTTYEVIATMVVDGENQLYVAAGVYGKPFESEVNSDFEYSSSAMSGLTSGRATLADGSEYAVPNIDRYFGIAEAAVTAENPTITTTLKRVAFGITAEGIDGELTVAVAGAPEVTMSAGDMEIYSLENLEAAYEADETTANYSETKSVEIIKNGASVKTANVEFFRNKLATISVNTTTGELGFDFEAPFEDMISIGSDNLYYSECQLSAEKLFWVNVEGSNEDAIEWYINDVYVGSGAEYTFTESTTTGEYTVKYVAAAEYLEQNEDITKSTIVNVYSSKGIYTLNEPNMTASEGCRGIDEYLYGEDVVTRFVEGDYTMFGSTNQYLSSSNGYLYSVASYTTSGVAFSKFDALTGDHKAVITLLPSATTSTINYAFEAIDQKQGVATNANGAYLIDLDNFTASENILSGSKGAKSIMVADGYIFMIVSSQVIAYSIDDLEAEPITIEGTLGATVGFVQSWDGDVWAASTTDFLRINTRDLTATTIALPNGTKLATDSWVFKQVSWAASTRDNTFFYCTGSVWGSAVVWKYDIDSSSCNSFVTTVDNLNSYWLYSNALEYDAEQDHLVCQTLQAYNSSSNLGIHIFDAQDASLNKEVLHTTVVDGYEGSKDLRFPAMMTPIKNY